MQWVTPNRDDYRSKHRFAEKSLKGTVAGIPDGSEQRGAYAIYSLAVWLRPEVLSCALRHITTASGCAITNIPVVDLPKGAPAIKQGALARVDADSGRITVKV